MSGANARTGVGHGSAEYGTPPELYAALHRRWRFDYDAFASHKNHLCPFYSTHGGTFLREFEDRRRKATMLGREDGLGWSWAGLRVFMNPPYTRGFLSRAVRKAFEEREMAEVIVALLPAGTDTRWWHEWVRRGAVVTFLRGRVSFISPKTGEAARNPAGASAIAEFRPDWLL